MPEPKEDQQNAQATEKLRRLPLRKDLLTSEDAREEARRRLMNVVPDLPALIVVLTMGGIGAALACWWHLNIGEKEFVSQVSKLPLLLRVFLGSIGATAAVFLLAKTDTSKLIHCSLIAVLSGMAGPYLVTKALSTVGVSPELLTLDTATIAVVTATTEKLESEIQKQTGAANPQNIVDILGQTAQATTSYLEVLKKAPQDVKQQSLAGTKQQFENTLKAFNTAAAVAPQQSLSLIAKVVAQANDAGATDIAKDAQNIIDNNPAMRAAAETAAKSGKVYFITSEELTDSVLGDLRDRIKATYPLADLQPVVHPARRMDDGLECIYYRDNQSDRRIAEDLSKLVAAYLKDRGILPKTTNVRRGTDDQAVSPFQFDIHLGPDIAANLVSSSPALTVNPVPASRSVKRSRRGR
jgi:hypothetical protein